MAKHIDLTTKTARGRLPLDPPNPYYETLNPGQLHLGYRRRRASEPGLWSVRVRIGDNEAQATATSAAIHVFMTSSSEPEFQSDQRPHQRGRLARRRDETRGVAGELLEAHADIGRELLGDLVAQASPTSKRDRPLPSWMAGSFCEATIASR